MYYLFAMKILQSRYYLSTTFLQFFNGKRPSLISKILIHIAALLELHDDVKLVVFREGVVRVYKILILYNTWVYKVLSNHKFTEHFSHRTGCDIRIVEVLSSLVDVSSFESYDATLENFRLGASR